MSAVVHLTHLYLPGMIARGSGDILIVASTAAFQAVPYITTYAATKSFDLQFAEGLAEEVRPVRSSRLRALSRLDGKRISPGGRAAPPHAAPAGNCGESRARGACGAGGGKEFGDFRVSRTGWARKPCGSCRAGWSRALPAECSVPKEK